MRSLNLARAQALACRSKIIESAGGLFDAVAEYIGREHELEIIPTTRAFLQGGRAEVSPAEYCLYYDGALDADPDRRLFVILHELGHLELHSRLKRLCADTDPLYGSMYLNDGAPALARYHRLGREEAEATAFATEFICPSVGVFEEWLKDENSTSAALAKKLGVPVPLVQAQLAEGLYRHTMDSDRAPEASREKAFGCDEKQLEAAVYSGGPALVNAGPGTGKTATLVRRVEHLLGDLREPPENLLVLTFSNDAAEELLERLGHRFGHRTAAAIEVSTFHGFGLALLRHHGQHAGLVEEFAVIDEVGQAELVHELLGRTECDGLLELDRPDEAVEGVVRHVSYLKDRLILPDFLAAELDAWEPADGDDDARAPARQFLNVFREYERLKAERGLVDFADLILLPVEILGRSDELRAAYRGRYRRVLVDEYQDVSRGVAALLRMVCDPAVNPPWVVGDVRQSIYRFRGAAPRNVTEFEKDFPGARVFELDTNYRSCPEIVAAANQLATLIEEPDREGGQWRSVWRPGTDTRALTSPAVSVFVADSDRAEREGVADLVKGWLESGVPEREVAVLARRNVDVRNISLALGGRGVRVITSGLITAEGAAGDLAAVVTLPDRPGASIPRLAYALGRGRHGRAVINEVIATALQSADDDGVFPPEGCGEGLTLAAEMNRACASLRAAGFTADAFSTLCVFLFDAGGYLRRALASEEGAARSLLLDEVLTSLSKAAAYRAAHPGLTARESRRGFGEHFRAALCSNTPCLVPPRADTDAVRVMTCHASKGLEFPCVVVAGQTLSRAKGGYEWLPPALGPDPDDDVRQSDSLLFVGVTRARRALCVSYAAAASASRGAKRREVVPLLRRWSSAGSVEPLTLRPRPDGREVITTGPVWGGAPIARLPARALDGGVCALRTYVEDVLGVNFPALLRPLYPVFISVTRYAMRRVVKRAHELSAPVGGDEAGAILLEEWAKAHVDVGHPHARFYLNAAAGYVTSFARAYRPEPAAVEQLGYVVEDPDSGLPLRLDLVSHYRAADGSRVAIAFRPESLSKGVRAEGLLWGTLKTKHRVSFVLLRDRAGELNPSVFSGEDGALYPYQRSGRRADYDKEASRVEERLRAFSQDRFEARPNAWDCDRCPTRVTCPHWLGALEEVSHES